MAHKRVRVLEGNGYRLYSPTVYGTDGETPENTALNLAFSATADSAASLSALVATNHDTGIYYVNLLAASHTANLDVLTCTWSGTVGSSVTRSLTQYVEVVGGHYVQTADLRSEPDLDSTTKFPTERIERFRDQFADLVEDVCGVAFVPRYARETLTGNDTSRLRLKWRQPRTIRSITVNGVSKTTTDFTLHPSGIIEWEDDTFPAPTSGDEGRNITVLYEHGFDSPPADLEEAGRRWVRAKLLGRTSGIPSNAISQTADGMTIRYSTPDPARGRYTGDMDLDAILNRYRDTAVLW